MRGRRAFPAGTWTIGFRRGWRPHSGTWSDARLSPQRANRERCAASHRRKDAAARDGRPPEVGVRLPGTLHRSNGLVLSLPTAARRLDELARGGGHDEWKILRPGEYPVALEHPL